MKTMKIFTKLIISFSVVIILASMLGITGMVTLSSVASPVKEIYQEHLLGVKYTSTALKGLELIRVYSAKLAIEAFTSNQKEMEKVKAELEPIFTEVDENLELFSKTKMNDELYSVFQEVMNGKSMLVEKLNTFKKACDNVYLGNTSTYNDAYNDLASYTSNIEATFEKMTQLKADAALEAKEYGEKIIRISRIVQILMIVIIVISSLAVAIFISAGIEKDLKKMVDQLLVTSQKIGSSVTQLTEASEVLADGSSQQAASIEETSATVNEASSLINQTTENVRQAAQIAKETSKSANDGMTKMSEMVHSMHEIKESSNTVSKIIKTINDIAFQTNLLAINATVEAARAGGEAGRSFSVVAEEVRNLAQKSAKAVDDTTMIIEKNILLTNDGEKISKDVEDYLKQITIESNSLSTIVNEVYVASDEQSGGIRQLNIAISQMDKIIQENVAVAEENAASANSVKEEISNLESVVEIAQSLIRQ